MSGSDVEALRSLELLNERALVAGVSKVGSLRVRSDRVYKYIVRDPEGHEIKWLSATFQMLPGMGYPITTIKSYAEAFLRLARAAWALGIDMAKLDAIGYTVCRSLLADPTRNGLGREYMPATLELTEAGLRTIYKVAIAVKAVSISDPIVRLVDKDKDVDGRSTSRDGSSSGEARFTGSKGGGRGGSKTVGRTLTEVERSVLLAATDPFRAALVQVLDDAGPRIREVLSITLASLHPESHTITVVAKSWGGKAVRVIPASDLTFERIFAYVAHLERGGIHVGPDDAIFRSPANDEVPLDRWGAYHVLTAMVPGASPHAIRRTTASRLLTQLPGSNDQRLFTVSLILGHKSLLTTQRYLHMADAELVSAFLYAVNTDNAEVATARPGDDATHVRSRVERMKAA